MKLFLKNVLLNNSQIKIFSLICGYVFWSIINQSHTDDVWVDLPVSFYQTANNTIINAPETIKVHLAGRRSALKAVDINNTAVHIDTQKLADGKQMIDVSREKVYLPDNVAITDWVEPKINVELVKNT